MASLEYVWSCKFMQILSILLSFIFCPFAFSPLRCTHSITECHERLIEAGGNTEGDRSSPQIVKRFVWLQPWLGFLAKFPSNHMTVHLEQKTTYHDGSSPYRCVARKEFAKRSKKSWGPQVQPHHHVWPWERVMWTSINKSRFLWRSNSNSMIMIHFDIL